MFRTAARHFKHAHGTHQANAPFRPARPTLPRRLRRLPSHARTRSAARAIGQTGDHPAGAAAFPDDARTVRMTVHRHLGRIARLQRRGGRAGHASNGRAYGRPARNTPPIAELREAGDPPRRILGWSFVAEHRRHGRRRFELERIDGCVDTAAACTIWSAISRSANQPAAVTRRAYPENAHHRAGSARAKALVTWTQRPRRFPIMAIPPCASSSSAASIIDAGDSNRYKVCTKGGIAIGPAS